MGGEPFVNKAQQGYAGHRGQKLVLQNRYEVIDHLGQGGMGTVYLTSDLRLHGRLAVVKKLRDDFFRDEDKAKALEFFKREITVLCSLRHDNIVDIKDQFDEGDDHYIVMEYVEGKNLHEMLHERGEPFPEEQVLQWAKQICAVLVHLHENDPPVIYRDLKPSNIMISVKGQVKLVDFGIARPYRDESDNTHVVSAGYSPPEQYWGAAEPRSDIYALGATMFFLLTGQEPLALQTSSPRSVNQAISQHADYIVEMATKQDMAMRFKDARDMLDELQYQPTLEKKKSFLPVSENFWGTAIAVSVVFIALGIVVFSWYTAFMPKPVQTKTIKVKDQEIERQLKESQAGFMKLKEQNQILLDHMRRGATVSDATKQMEAAPVIGDAKTTVRDPELLLKEDSEAQLTDPEGLAPVEDESSRFGFPLFRSTDIK